MKFRILDRISESGDLHNTALNDDAIGVGIDERVAIVADGATGLSETSYIGDCVSDARWIAEFTIEMMIHSPVDHPVRDLVAEAIAGAREAVSRDKSISNIPRYAWPAASFIMARLQQGHLEISGLGDCVAFVQMDDGYVERFSALEDQSEKEAAEAKRDIGKRRGEVSGSDNAFIRTPEVLASLRAKRERNNTPESGIWSVSLEPDAANHVMSIAVPLQGVERILLASDGFSAAFDRYQLAVPGRFMATKEACPLATLQAEIRRIEREIDPACIRFPRYKQSDDSSAILLEVGK